MIEVSILDYGAGNLENIFRAVKYVGARPRLVSNDKVNTNCSHMILPGVGAFGSAMQELKARNLIDGILRHVLAGKPFLGICLGM